MDFEAFAEQYSYPPIPTHKVSRLEVQNGKPITITEDKPRKGSFDGECGLVIERFLPEDNFKARFAKHDSERFESKMCYSTYKFNRRQYSYRYQSIEDVVKTPNGEKGSIPLVKGSLVRMWYRWDASDSSWVLDGTVQTVNRPALERKAKEIAEDISAKWRQDHKDEIKNSLRYQEKPALAEDYVTRKKTGRKVKSQADKVLSKIEAKPITQKESEVLEPIKIQVPTGKGKKHTWKYQAKQIIKEMEG